MGVAADEGNNNLNDNEDEGKKEREFGRQGPLIEPANQVRSAALTMQQHCIDVEKWPDGWSTRYPTQKHMPKRINTRRRLSLEGIEQPTRGRSTDDVTDPNSTSTSTSTSFGNRRSKSAESLSSLITGTFKM
jgi:hypothetical protein